MVLGHHSYSLHIPARREARQKCGLQAGKTPTKPDPSWNLPAQALGAVGLGQQNTPNVLSKERKLSNSTIPGPGPGPPRRPWGRSHTELMKCWEGGSGPGMGGDGGASRHSPHTYHVYMALLGILKQVSAGFQ